MKKIFLGNKNEERLFLKNDSFLFDGGKVIAKKTNMPKLDEIIARHRARYGLVSLFLRPNYKVLDVPCGSGYASELFKPFNIQYEGQDICKYAVAYAKRNYKGKYKVGNLHNLKIKNNYYDVISCIEGLEHIDQIGQDDAIDSFSKALKPTGTLIISSPKIKGRSKASVINPYHLRELNATDFKRLLTKFFSNVQILTVKDKIHTGETTTFLYGVCKNDKFRE